MSQEAESKLLREEISKLREEIKSLRNSLIPQIVYVPQIRYIPYQPYVPLAPIFTWTNNFTSGTGSYNLQSAS